MFYEGQPVALERMLAVRVRLAAKVLLGKEDLLRARMFRQYIS